MPACVPGGALWRGGLFSRGFDPGPVLERREVVSGVAGGLPLGKIVDDSEGLLAMKPLEPLPEILSSLCKGNVCERFGESGRRCEARSISPPAGDEPGLTASKPAGRGFVEARDTALAEGPRGRGGCSSRSSFGPCEISASEGFLLPLAVEGLCTESALLPKVPFLFLLREPPIDRARDRRDEERLPGRDWL